jgi:AraC family transcriptional regulator of adaptative response/methylated-DNA-[protein]-cysteine methyltransferase
MKTIIYSIHKTDLGEVLIATYNDKLCRVAIGSYGPGLVDRYLNGKPFNKFDLEFDWNNNLIDAELTKKVLNVITTGAVEFIDCYLMGTSFQKKVWNEISQIPSGETITYGELSARAGVPTAYRAVGTACGQNPLAVIIPCHRVMRTDGTIGNYAWGVLLKRQLLQREGYDINKLFKIKGKKFVSSHDEICKVEDAKILRYLRKISKDSKTTNKI